MYIDLWIDAPHPCQKYNKKDFALMCKKRQAYMIQFRQLHMQKLLMRIKFKTG